MSRRGEQRTYLLAAKKMPNNKNKTNGNLKNEKHVFYLLLKVLVKVNGRPTLRFIILHKKVMWNTSHLTLFSYISELKIGHY